jgi:hypothetical protein
MAWASRYETWPVHGRLEGKNGKKSKDVSGIDCATAVGFPRAGLVYFTMTRNNSNQHFGNLVISAEFWAVGTMPSGCTIFVDEQRPENCRVNFDANTYDRNALQSMLDRYLLLLEAAAENPELPLEKLLMITQLEDALAELLAEGGV